jgi:hypothetical protein
MRDGWKRRWGWSVSAVVLVGGLLVLGTGTVVTAAGLGDDATIKEILDLVQRSERHLNNIKAGGGEEANHTLRWDTNNPSATRFTTAFPGAVLDKNTGLVWEQAPDALLTDWGTATSNCLDKIVDNTVGWRLPSVVELKSLQDPTPGKTTVPQSVFTFIGQFYWSATTGEFAAIQTTHAWAVDFNRGGPSRLKVKKGGEKFPVWCVRGGMNADAYGGF